MENQIINLNLRQKDVRIGEPFVLGLREAGPLQMVEGDLELTHMELSLSSLRTNIEESLTLEYGCHEEPADFAFSYAADDVITVLEALNKGILNTLKSSSKGVHVLRSYWIWGADNSGRTM